MLQYTEVFANTVKNDSLSAIFYMFELETYSWYYMVFLFYELNCKRGACTTDFLVPPHLTIANSDFWANVRISFVHLKIPLRKFAYTCSNVKKREGALWSLCSRIYKFY